MAKVEDDVVEQIIRPTGLIDPEVIVKPTKGQIDDLISQIRLRVERNERVLVTTLTKKMSEDLTDYLLEAGIRTRYLHSEVDTLRRVELLRELRMGEYDVLVGINLLREGLDLPEVSLVAILDADKEGFLRSGRSLIQTIGRAARNVSGQVIMYADRITDSMETAIEETNRRRAKQVAYNTANNIDPTPLRKKIGDITDMLAREDADTEKLLAATGDHRRKGAPVPLGQHTADLCQPAVGRAGRPHRAAQRADACGSGRAAVRGGRADCETRSAISRRSCAACSKPASELGRTAADSTSVHDTVRVTDVLDNGRVQATIDPSRGARLTSLVIDGHELLAR